MDEITMWPLQRAILELKKDNATLRKIKALRYLRLLSFRIEKDILLLEKVVITQTQPDHDDSMFNIKIDMDVLGSAPHLRSIVQC